MHNQSIDLMSEQVSTFTKNKTFKLQAKINVKVIQTDFGPQCPNVLVFQQISSNVDTFLFLFLWPVF